MNKCFTEFAGAVASLDEKGVIDRICVALGAAVAPSPRGPGDDCAVLPLDTICGRLLATADPVILHRHFTVDTDPYLVGRKLLNRNISDIASMGGRPLYAVTGAVLAEQTSLKWLDEFCRGMASAAACYGIEFAGGDVSKGPENFISMHLTLLGECQNPLLRTGAREGDAIFVTGPLGASLESGRHLDFVPRVKEGAWLAEGGWATACTDISDGLAADLPAMAPVGCRALLESENIPLAPHPANTLSKALNDGEDYELLFTVPEAAVGEMSAAFNKAFGYSPHHIGRIEKAPDSCECGAYIKTSEGEIPLLKGGFSHF